MPGNSQGIVVSIQAKIEGWLSQIKAIQDALKNIKAGTGISKDLTKDLKQVESLVNNLGKNINQRLTSDSQITGFTDKLREVDEIFAHMGQRMTSISFADMDPSYITNNFKDLLTAIELANNALSSGMTNSFLSAIAESTNLLKAFDKLGIDPSKMGAEELKKLLETKSSDLEKALIKANNELKNLLHNAAEARKIMSDMESAKILEISDTKATAKNLIGDTTKLGHTEIDPAKLLEFATLIDNILVNGGARLELKLKEKREQVDLAIKQLINALTVEEARLKLLEIEDIFASVRAKSEFTIKVDKIKDEELTSWIPDPIAVLNKLSQIQAVLNDYKIDPKVLKNINMEDLIKSGNFDKLADEIDKALKKALVAAEKDVEKIRATVQKLETAEHDKLGEINSTSATKYNIDLGLSQWDGMILKILLENAALREEVEKLKAQLAERAIANVKALGGKTAASGALGILDSTNAAKAYEALLGRVKSAEQALGKLQGVVLRWFSIYAVIRMVNNAIHSMINTIKELDKTITNIAIVTDMSQDDLWKLMPKYTQMARDYASSIAGVYEVSQLYYQQGLEMAEVMSLTEATLKMARISGLGYADATDYMTNAVRSFKMEMSEATTVVDVYSAVAASSATSVTELATAMSKTASSAEAVGSSFLNTTAMMAVMIEATRESPENIGSALKSIISRYGELKLNMTGTDAEGEEYSLNKVDTALQSIGISIHDVNGEFRDFDEVIMELAGKWDTVDKNTQRYIATVMAGNRQQSRFLALVSSGDRLRELADEAANSEDASQLQFLKSLDSIDSKVQLLLTSILALYTNSGLELTYKGILDFANRVVTSLDNISDSLGLAGVGAKIASVFTTLATLVTNLFTTIKLKFSVMQALMTANAKLAVNERVIAELTAASETAATELERVNAHARAEAAMTETTRLENEKRIAEAMKASNWKRNTGMIAATAGLTLATAAGGMDLNTLRQEKAWLTGIGSALSGIGTGFMMGGWVGAIVGTLTSLPGIIEAIGMSSESVSEKLTRLKSNVTEAQNKAIISKDELKNLTQYEEKLKELASKQYDSNADRLAYLDLSNEIANKYPELISYIDEEGNKIVELGEAYANLKQLKLDAYNADAISASVARVRAASDAHYRLSEAGVSVPERQKDWLSETGDFLGYLGNDLINLIRGNINNNGSANLFSLSGSAFDFIASNLANTGFSAAMIDAHKAGYGQGSYWDTMAAVFGKNKVLNLKGSNISSALKAGGLNVDDLMINTIINLPNISAQMGKLVDVLMEQNASKSEINKALSILYGEETKINDDLYNYRLLVLSSEKATRGAQKLIEAENKNLYSVTIALDKYDITSNLENQFLQYDFLNLWDSISEGLNDDLIASAWEAFALNAEENIDLAIISYTSMIDSITDTATLLRLDSMFKNASSYTATEWQSMAETALMSGNEELGKFLLDYYNDNIKRASDNFIQSYKNLSARYDVNVDSRFDLIAENVGKEYLSSIISLYEDIFKNKNLSNNQKQILVNSLENAYLATSNIEDIDKRNLVLSTLNTADLTTLTGIYQAIDIINKMKLGKYGDSIATELLTLASHISINLVTEFTSFSDTVVKGMSDFEKAISNATKGMDLKAATEMAEKMGKSITDFTYRDGKYFYEGLDDIEAAYLPQNEEALRALKTRLDNTKSNIKELSLETPNILNMEEIEFINPEMLNDDAYLDAWSNEFEKLGYSINDVLNYVLGNFDESLVDTEGWELIKALSKTNFVEISEKISSDIDQLVWTYDNKEDIFSIIDSSEFEEPEGLNKETLKSYIGQYMDRTEEDLNLSFSDWLIKYLDLLYEENKTAIDNYTKDLKARTYLSNGNIEAFLLTTGAYKTASDYYFGGNTLEQAQLEADLANQQLISTISSGDITNLPAELQLYAKLVYDTYNKISSNIFSTVISALEKGSDAALEVNTLNADKLIESGLVQRSDIYDEKGNLTTSMVIIPYEQIKNMTDAEFDNFLNATATSYEDRVKAIGIRMAKDRPDIKVSTEKVNDDLKNISYDEITSMWHDMGILDKENVTLEEISKLMQEWGLRYDAYGNIIGDATLIDKEIENLLQLYISGKISREEWLKLKYKLELFKEDITSESDLTKGKALSDVIDNYTSVSSEQFSDLMGAFADLTLELRTALESTFTLNADGTRTFDVTKFKLLVANGIIPLSLGVNHIIEESLEKLIDNARSALTNTAKLVSTGTTSEVEMLKLLDTMIDLGIFEGANLSDVFEYDDLLDAWTLKPEVLYEYAQKLAESLGLKGEELTKFVEAQTLKPLAEAVDISSYITAANLNGLAATNLRTLLKNWATLHWYGVKPDEATLDRWMNIISTGGQEAVDLAMQIAADAEKELSAEEMQQYYAPLVAKYSSIAEEIPKLVVGQYVGEGDLRDILVEANIVDASTGLVKEVTNMAEAYKAIYDKMKDATGKTTSDLNSIYAKYLTELELGDIDAVSAMGDAMGMTYDTLGQILAKTGDKLEDWLKDNADQYESIGAGKIRITDFAQFAKDRGWMPGSEEYTQAFKAYNDALIELDHKTENAIYEELSSIIDAKAGDRINVTLLQTALGLSNEAINTYLRELGGYIEDGILTIVNANDIPAIIAALAERASEAELVIPEKMAELLDAINGFLENITSIISKGIKGGLTAKDVQTLESWSGLDLDTTRMKDGLKLSLKSAEELYEKLKLIDSISALIVLDELNDSIELSVTSAKELEGIMREVAEIRATTESDDFKFMSHNIPSGLNNPINYLENWSKAFKVMNEAGKAGGKMKNMMDYTDFYNIITEMGNLALLTGEIKLSGDRVLHNCLDAADLIEAGAAALSVAADGSIKVDLSQLGIDFSTGASDLKANVGKGILEVAKSQVEMLDSMIQLLETIVAMEELGDIDVEGNGIDLGEMFKVDDEGNFILDENGLVQWQEGMSAAADKILKTAEELGPDSDLYKGLENVKANGISMRKIFEDARDGVKLTTEDATAYHAVVAAFYKAMLSGDYSTESIMASIKEVLANTGYEGTIEVGDMKLVIKNGFILEQDKEGKYIVDGHAFNTELAAFNALAAGSITALLGAIKSYDEETGNVTYKAGTFTVSTEYDVENNSFKAHFSDGGEVTATSLEALNTAIKVYMLAMQLQVGNVEGEGNQAALQTQEFSITVKGLATLNYEITEVDGETKIIDKSQGAIFANDAANGSNRNKFSTITQKIALEITLSKNATKDALKENEDTAKNGVTLDIKFTSNKTGEALLENINKAIEGVLQNINAGFNAVILLLEANRLYAKNNPVIQEIKSSGGKSGGLSGTPGATGNVGLARAQGTLMGELGPELVVSNGRYFVAGQNGAEFVDLAEDAIVFNHLQTEQLLKHGMSSTRGAAVTNERNAVAFAQGNVNGGPAMASAKAALAALKQLRAQWQAIAGMGAADLAGLGGSGGGGGGGGKKNDPKAFVKELEKWYNWLQRIAVLEQKITYEEAKRSKLQSEMIAHGQDYALSNLETLKYLRELAVINQSLADSLQEYFDKRREEMNSANNPFSALYTFDEYGQLKYKDGKLAELSQLVGRNSLTGKGNFNVLEQYNKLVSMGYGAYMEYDSSGNKIDKESEGWETTAVLAFWDKIDSDKEEMQSLHDSIEEHKQAVLEDQQKANEILREIEDNQISVEDKVLKAIEDTRQREIDELLKLRDAIEKASLNLIDGLSLQLSKELDMYSLLTSQDELTKLLRLLGILLNSGGSSSLIASLQKEISLKQLDAYFEAQQRLIDALQEASDNELARLDQQIELMTETLEYEKENGLLWNAVYEVMAGTPEQITDFITTHDSEYWGESPTKLTLDTREVLFEAQQFTTYRDEMKDGLHAMAASFSDYAIKADAAIESARAEAAAAKSAAAATNLGTGNNGDSSGNNGGGSGNGGTTNNSGNSGNSGNTGPSHWKVNGILPNGSPANLGPYNSKNAAERMLTQASRNGWRNLTISSYDRGGMIDTDKLAIVHAKESVLTAEQTRTLREDILSNKPTSLLSLLSDFRDAYNSIPGASDYNTINNNSGTTIELAIVEMHVSKIANDYDAQRAGEQALEKMVQIARKTQGLRVGR